jgi:hypothetical protein
MYVGVKLIFFVCFALVGAVGGVHRVMYGPRAQARKRLRNASRELTDGAVVTLTGVVRAKGEMLTAPLSGRQAVAFSSTARIYAGEGYYRHVADSVHQQQMVDFVLETKEAVVEIESATAELEYAPEPLIPRKIQREQAFLRAAGHNVHPRSSSFDEVVIAPGMKVSIHGVVRIEVAGAEGYRETGKRIVLASHPAHPLTIGRPI